MEPRKKKQQRNDWYSVSVESLRAWLALGGVALALVAGLLVYRSRQASFEKRAGEQALAEAEELITRLRGREGIQRYREDLATARDSLTEAGTFLTEGDHHKAYLAASSSRDLLRWILDSLENPGGDEGGAKLISAEGQVQVRRGENGDWEPARTGMVLRHGDYVRTSTGGSAEVMFGNGTLSTLRPETMVLIPRPRSASGKEQGLSMKYGWVNLSTSENESSVQTPDAEARVDRSSEAAVAYDEGSGKATFVAYEGRVRVAARDGSERIVRPLEQVSQQGQKLGGTSSLPARVDLAEPADGAQINLDTTRRLGLSWQPVPGAARYHLQIARNHHFVDLVIEDEQRTRTGASLKLQAEGSFDWQVAALDRNGNRGPWSEPRKFRVASLTGSADRDTTPPRLELQYVRPYGSLFILGGATEPGAGVEVNGEPATVASDGTFTKTIQLFEEGWRILTIRARDLAGNTNERRHRVFVEPF